MQWPKTAITKFGNKNCIDKHIWGDMTERANELVKAILAC